jgi:hypothetical protein
MIMTWFQRRDTRSHGGHPPGGLSTAEEKPMTFEGSAQLARIADLPS